MYRGMDTYNQGHAKDKILLFPTDMISQGLKYVIDRSEGRLRVDFEFSYWYSGSSLWFVFRKKR